MQVPHVPMVDLHRFARKSIGWLFLVILIPLAVLLVMQVRFLREVADATVVTERERLNNWIDDVTGEFEAHYRRHATAALEVGPGQLREDVPGFTAEQLGAARRVGARTLFLMRFQQGGSSEVFYFDPATGNEKAPPLAQEHAVWITTASWSLAARKDAIVPTPSLDVDERDPANRMILRPIADDAMHVAGVAGLVLDPARAKGWILPETIRRNVERRFPEPAQREEVAALVTDSSGAKVYAFGRVLDRTRLLTASVPFVFTDWRIGIQGSCSSPEEIARWHLRVNLIWTAALGLMLFGSIALALRTASKEMRLSQMKSDFVSNVSHELRTPLSSIRVFGEYMKLGRVHDGDKIREYGTYIETEGRRLTQLINNILDFSKIESAEKKYRFREEDLEDVVAGVVTAFRLPLERGAMSVRFEPASEPLPPVLVDREAIAQALFNLLDNAVKYSGTSNEVVVQLGRTGPWARLAVIDRGIGIAPTEQKKIFEKFYRVGSALVHDVKGSGLGLAIVAHIVRAHGGKIDVESRPGEGSAFIIQIPLASAAHPAPEAMGREAGAET